MLTMIKMLVLGRC